VATSDPPPLVLRAQKGDEEAFTQLVSLFERRVLAYFLARTPSLPTAEDLAQETFVRAFTALPGLEEASRFPSWLFGIARNAYREWSRDRKKHAQPPERPTGDAQPILDRKVSLHKEIYQIVHELPDPYREVLLLRYFDGASTPEIAASLDRPLGTVTKQVSRAHAMVADRVKSLRGHTTLLRFLLPKEVARG
jgi:RNA polymerase sigma-70 factor, ECF subfamily